MISIFRLFYFVLQIYGDFLNHQIFVKLFCSGGWNRTTDLKVMSLASCLCSTPQCKSIYYKHSPLFVFLQTFLTFFHLLNIYHMIKSVYRFNFYQSNQFLENRIEERGFDSNEVFEQLKDCISYDKEIDGILEEIILVDEKQFQLIVSILEDCEIKFVYKDITIDVLHSKVSFDDDYFQEKIDDFVQNNLTLDLILDKINLYGLDSLKDFERNFLKLF